MKDLLPPPLSLPPQIDKEEEGYEVEPGPPPAYPGEVSDTISVVGNDTSADDEPPSQIYRPQPPTAAATSQKRVDKPPLKPVSNPPAVSPTSSSFPSAVSSFFSIGNKKNNTEVTKAQLKDAIELTRFALSALEDKDLELGVRRLQEALTSLGR
jgi:hypothetical protein